MTDLTDQRSKTVKVTVGGVEFEVWQPRPNHTVINRWRDGRKGVTGHWAFVPEYTSKNRKSPAWQKVFRAWKAKIVAEEINAMFAEEEEISEL